MDIVVGKTYERRKVNSNGLRRKVKVLFVGKQVVLYTSDCGEGACQINSFLTGYQEVPPWKPKVGKEAYFKGSTYIDCWGMVIAIEGNHAWFKPISSGAFGGIVVLLTDLHEKND